MSDNNLRDFPTYGGLSRSAMLFGVPLMALIAVMVGSLMVLMSLQKIFGIWSYLFLIVSVAILLLIKSICATDDQAMRILGLEVQWFMKKTNKIIWANNLVLLPMKYGRQKDESKNFISNLFSKTLNAQGAIQDFMPKVNRHITQNFVRYDDDKIAAVVELGGMTFEGLDDDQVNIKLSNQLKNFNALAKGLGERLGLCLTFMRKESQLSDDYSFKNPFTKQFGKKYLGNFKGEKLFHNRFYVTILIKPDSSDLEDNIAEVEKIVEQFLKGFERYEPRLLGTYINEYEVIFSEVFAVLGEILNYEKSPMLN